MRNIFGRISALENPPPWSTLAALGGVVVSFAATVLGSFIVLALLGDKQYKELAAWTIGAVLTIIFVYIRFGKPEQRAALHLGGGGNVVMVQQAFLMLLIGVGLSVALDVVSGRVTSGFLPEPELTYLYNAVTINRGTITVLSWIFAVLFMVIAQPIAEELIFRGVLLSSLRSMIGAWPGYILSALLYALFHLIAYGSSISDFNGLWYGQVLPFVGGLIFGAVRLTTGSTRAAILAHVGFGLFAVVKMLTLAG
ncbi:MAG: type II CAAX endopeptidase family protein [Chloroflexota bacterium]